MAKYRATFLKRDKWWVGWTDDVPGALTQGRTLKEARENLKDAIALMLEDVDTSQLPESDRKLVHEEIEV
jgi:predicted RNase H-like HicB family nuclease